MKIINQTQQTNPTTIPKRLRNSLTKMERERANGRKKKERTTRNTNEESSDSFKISTENQEPTEPNESKNQTKKRLEIQSHKTLIKNHLITSPITIETQESTSPNKSKTKMG